MISVRQPAQCVFPLVVSGSHDHVVGMGFNVALVFDEERFSLLLWPLWEKTLKPAAYSIQFKDVYYQDYILYKIYPRKTESLE